MLAAIAAAIAMIFSMVFFGSAAQAAPTVGIYLDNLAGTATNYTISWLGASGSKLFFHQNGNLYVFDKDLDTTVELLPDHTILTSNNPFAFADGKLVFNAYEATHGQELYISDGTVAGTSLLKDILPGSAESQPGFFMQFGQRVVFKTRNVGNTSNELWITDGTSVGTTKIRDMTYITNYGSAVLNGKLYFRGDNGGSGARIWSTDGVTASQVSSIIPEEANLTTYNGWVYFNGDAAHADVSNRGNGVTGYELLRTNGTVVEIAADVNPTTSNSSWSKPTNLTVMNNKLYFSANDGVHGYELMSFDGTNVALIKDQYVGIGSSSPWLMTPINGVIYYAAVDSSNDRELYSSDGTEAGTNIVQNMFPGSIVCGQYDFMCFGGPNQGDPRYFVEFDGKVVFASKSSSHGTEIFAITPAAVVTPPNQTVTVTPVAPVVPVFKQPKFEMPSRIEIDSTGKVSLSGKDMDVASVLIGGVMQRIDFNSETKLEFDASGLKPGSYDLVMKGAFGTYTVQKAIYVGQPVVTKVAGISERTMSVDGGELSIRGVGLEGTTQISMNGRVLEIVNKTDDLVTFKVPASTVLSRNALMIEGSFTPMIFNNAFSYNR